MKFLTDENLGQRVPQHLRSLGLDVISVSELLPGANDQDVLAYANSQGRILITLDKDFGELVFNQGFIHKGVILLRLKDESAENKMRILETLLRSEESFKGKFTVFRE